MMFDRFITSIRVSRFRAALAAACFSVCGMAFAGVDRPALIDGAVVDAPDEQPVLGEAEQGRWLATIHPQALALDSAQQGRGTDNSTDPAVGIRFAVDLPGSGRLELVIENLTEVVEGVTTMTGSLADEGNGDFVLSLEGDQLLGTIEEGTHIWLVEPDARGSHLLRKVHRGLIPRVPGEEDYRVPPPAPEASKSISKSIVAPMSGTNGGVDVLFLYASNVTNPALRASDIVGRFTLVRNNSLISTNNSITSVGVYPVASSFAGLSKDAVLDDMNGRSLPFTNLNDWIFHANADTVFLLLTEDPSAIDYPGYGRVGGLANVGIAHPGTKNHPFALSTITYALGDNSAIHELGHAFGGWHENEADPLEPYHPATASDCSWMTIMGGYPCGFDGLPATTIRINYFSNPALSPAAAGGNVIGVPGSADMESWLESSMPIISAWRNNGAVTAPAASGSIWHVSLMCWGENRIAWSSVSGASEYRVFESASSDFIAPTQVYQGSATHINVSVPAGGRFYRVHACNSAGCSNWTGTEHALYYSSCP